MCAQDVRQVLHDELAKLNGDKDWSFILRQLGMFSFTGLNPAQVRILMARVHLYEHSTDERISGYFGDRVDPGLTGTGLGTIFFCPL